MNRRRRIAVCYLSLKDGSNRCPVFVGSSLFPAHIVYIRAQRVKAIDTLDALSKSRPRRDEVLMGAYYVDPTHGKKETESAAAQFVRRRGAGRLKGGSRGRELPA